MIHHEETCELHCTDNDKTVSADIAHFRLHDGLTVYLAGNKIVLKYNKQHDIYVGNLAGREFTTKGPKYFETKQRGY